MTPEQRRRAGEAVAARIDYLHANVAEVADTARVDPATVRRLIRGEHWPRDDTRNRIADALGWPHGELMRHAIGETSSDLHGATTGALIVELCERYTNGHLSGT